MQSSGTRFIQVPQTRSRPVSVLATAPVTALIQAFVRRLIVSDTEEPPRLDGVRSTFTGSALAAYAAGTKELAPAESNARITMPRQKANGGTEPVETAIPRPPNIPTSAPATAGISVLMSMSV